jgi:hypothetical protein
MDFVYIFCIEDNISFSVQFDQIVGTWFSWMFASVWVVNCEHESRIEELGALFSCKTTW